MFFLTLQHFFKYGIRTVRHFDVFLLLGTDYCFIFQHEVILFEVCMELVTLLALEEPKFIGEVHESGNRFDSLKETKRNKSGLKFVRNLNTNSLLASLGAWQWFPCKSIANLL